MISMNEMPNLNYTKIQYYDNSAKIDNLFGFYCSIETKTSSYLGLLLYRTNTNLIFTLGSIKS